MFLDRKRNTIGNPQVLRGQQSEETAEGGHNRGRNERGAHRRDTGKVAPHKSEQTHKGHRTRKNETPNHKGEYERSKTRS